MKQFVFGIVLGALVCLTGCCTYVKAPEVVSKNTYAVMVDCGNCKYSGGDFGFLYALIPKGELTDQYIPTLACPKCGMHTLSK